MKRYYLLEDGTVVDIQERQDLLKAMLDMLKDFPEGTVVRPSELDGKKVIAESNFKERLFKKEVHD